MKLIGSLTSPYVRKIRVLLLEKQIPFEFINDPPFGEHTQVPQYNPLGKVPILETDDAEVFCDSKIIAQYLELQPSKALFLPQDPMQALRVKQMEALVDGVTDAAVAVYLEKKRPDSKQDSSWIARQELKVKRGLEALEARAKEDAWLCGDQMTLADIALGSLMQWIVIRLPEQANWRDAHPHLAALTAQLFARPSFTQTEPPA